MPKLQHTRHNEILERLGNGEILSITELAREWNIGEKTIQRDFKKLVEGNYGVIRAEDGKRFTITNKKITTKEVSLAINILDSLSEDIGGEFYKKAQTALHKIQTHIDSPFYTRIDVEDMSNHMDLIEQLESAISEQKMISLKYRKWHKPDDVKIHKKVKPYKIIVFDGFFYLYCEIGNFCPALYLKEITDLKILEQTFEHKDNILKSLQKAQDIWFNPNKDEFEVIFHLDATAKVYFKRKPIKDQQIREYKDGTAELTIYISNKETAFAILKKWLPHVKVVEPMWLQDEFESKLRLYITK
jgi:predicted DNA-binding transcriptional regulator YafY